MKKLTAVLIALIMALSVCNFTVFASSEALPESSHNYPDNCFDEWNYTYPEEVKALLVTFSEDTYVEKYNAFIPFIDVKSAAVETNANVINIFDFKRGDYIAVYDGSDELIGTYEGDELAGKTVFVKGNSFSVILSSDSSVNYYGFKVTDVVPCPDEDLTEITYYPGTHPGEAYSKLYYKGDAAELDYSFNGNYYDDSDDLFCGWALSENGEVCYEGGADVALTGEDLSLYAIWCGALLGSDEIFYFSNSSWYFDVDGNDAYYMTADDYHMMQLNLYKNWGIGPIPAPIVSIVLTQYPSWEFRGSCYGMSAVTALQHYGYIDVLSLQNADCLYDMDVDEELISYINYYQSQAASSYLTENVALDPGSLVYKQAMKTMYDEVASGKIVLFTFYQGTPFVTVGHTVLMVGAYTNADGEHVLLAYDCNRPSRYHSANYPQFVIAEDYSSISYDDEELGAINWTSDFDHFKSFDIEGKGSPIDWYKELFRHILQMFKNFFEMFRFLFK